MCGGIIINFKHCLSYIFLSQCYTFRHKGNGAILARCSQPEVGWLGWRSSEDEDLLKAIAESCQNKSKKPKVSIHISLECK